MSRVSIKVEGYAAVSTRKCTDQACEGNVTTRQHVNYRGTVSFIKKRKRSSNTIYGLCDYYFLTFDSAIPYKGTHTSRLGIASTSTLLGPSIEIKIVSIRP